MTAKWLIPALAYVAVLGALGVTGKLALRTLQWQDLLLWTTVGYIIASAIVLGLGQASVRFEVNTWWALLSAVLAIGGLVFLYLALGWGEASKVMPITAAYPAVTLLLAAWTLSERLSLAKLGGVVLVIGGVILLTIGPVGDRAERAPVVERHQQQPGD